MTGELGAAKRRRLLSQAVPNLAVELIPLALQNAQRLAVRDQLPDPGYYRARHPTLRSYFQTLVVPEIENGTDQAFAQAVLLGASLVYSWMPTVLRGVRYEAAQNAKPLLTKIVRLADVSGFASLLCASKREPELLNLLTLVNGSIVGTSKFLHFLSPSAVPILDDNIAGLLNGNVDTLIGYQCYVCAVARAIAEAGDGYPDYARMVGSAAAPLLDARSLEFALFLNAPRPRKTKKPRGGGNTPQQG